MARRIGSALRLAALCILTALVAACSPMEAPRLGSGPPILSPKTLGTLTTPAPTSKVVTLALAPVTNVPGEMAYAFEDAMKAKAPTRQMKVLKANDPTADYRVVPYLSAVGDSSEGMILYVLDVFDKNGKRVHRVSGQMRGGGSSTGDPWSTIRGTSDVAKVAQMAIDALGNWVHG